jgi:hypothetical protein
MLIKLPPNVAAIGKLASKDAGDKLAYCNVRIRQTEDGCRLEATDGKRLGIVELAGALVPGKEFDDAPNGAMEVLIPTREFTKAAKDGRPESLWQLGHERCTVQTGMDGTRHQIVPAEGRFPLIDDAIRDYSKPPAVEVWLDAKYFRDLLDVAAEFSDGDLNKVLLRYWDPDRPVAVVSENREQRFFGLLMPLGGFTARPPQDGVFLVKGWELLAHPDKIAPVSGARCRSCGANPANLPRDSVWLVQDGAAYCFTCREHELDLEEPLPEPEEEGDEEQDEEGDEEEDGQEELE